VSRPLFLIGYRGTGKSAVARLLANRLGWTWLDADAVLEEREGRSIRKIFAEQGEEHFRDLEAAILAELCQAKNHVIATGGGVVLRAQNRRLLKESGLVAWLTADVATLWQRLQADPTTQDRRPNLATGGIAEIETLLRAREPYYSECAQFTVNTAGLGPDEVAAAILQWCEVD
jgi:shikimate kinase